MDFKKIFEKLKSDDTKKTLNNKTVMNLLIIFLMGVLILLAGSFFKTTSNSVKETISGGDKNNTPEEAVMKKPENESESEKELRYDLKNILQQTEGVGRVEVMLYFASGEEQVPALNINDSVNSTEEIDNEGGRRQTTQKNNGSTVVITNNGDKTQPLIVKKNKPKVTGVLIVAEGAEDKVIEYRIRKAVINLFDITDNKVNVYPMKK